MADGGAADVAQPSETHANRVRRVLEERARALTRVADDETVVDTVDLVVLEVGPERYGIDMGRVREVREAGRLAPIPGAPALWSGVVNLRGSLFAVLDLRAYLGLTHDGREEQPKVVLVAASGLEVGLLVGGVSEVRTVPAGEIEALAGPPTQPGAAVRGVTADLVSVLDLDAVLSDPRLNAATESGPDAGGES